MALDLSLDVTLRQGTFTLEVSRDVSCHTLALVGASGAGKTTLLEVVAGLRTPDRGRVALGGRVLFDSASRIEVPARHRGVGYVPQDALLFPHLNVRRNILYGAPRDGRLALAHVLEILEIEPLVDRRIDRLSGGERQRVALARALMASPSLLLLDEPFAALDPSLRWRIVPCLERIRDELGLPMLVASHDLELVGTIADTVIALATGRIATPQA